MTQQHTVEFAELHDFAFKHLLASSSADDKTLWAHVQYRDVCWVIERHCENIPRMFNQLGLAVDVYNSIIGKGD